MTAPLLSVRELGKRFIAERSLTGRARTYVNAVDRISFDVEAGETFALVGESGCGKSTAARAILRLIEPSSGSVTYAGRDVGSFATRELKRFRADVQLIFQDPYASLNPRMTVGDTLAEPLLLHTAMSRADRHGRVGELLRTVGLKAEHASRYPHEFSGGQRQRIAIARALAPEPKLVICDEPVSALDVSIRAQILNLLQDLQQRFGLCYIFISHDLGVVRHIANRVGVMYLGRLIETASVDELFTAPRHPYTQALLSAIPVPRPAAKRTRHLLPGDPPSPIHPPAGCHLSPRCPHVRDKCRRTAPELDGLAPDHATACHFWREFEVSGSLEMDAGPPSATLARLFDRFGPTPGHEQGKP